MFYIGEEVVCVDDVFPDGSKPIVRGQHYIIRWQGHVKFLDKFCVRVTGVVRPIDGGEVSKFSVARSLFDLAKNFMDADDPRVQEAQDHLDEAESFIKDFPLRATRFRSLKKTTNQVEEMKKLLVPQTRVLEDA